MLTGTLSAWLATSGAFLISTYRYFGLAGCAIIGLASLYAALRYTGSQQERYSIFNHFISELGEFGVSSQARVFNLGLVLGGLTLVFFVAGLGLQLSGMWGWLGLLAGLWAAISLILVGLYPMNNLEAHGRVAISYFRAGLVMVLLFGIAIIAQPDGNSVIPKVANMAGVLAAGTYGAFLVMLRKPAGEESDSQDVEVLDADETRERPRFWLLPVMEWAVFFSTLIWFFCVAFVTLL
jgi:hypothetical protein